MNINKAIRTASFRTLTPKEQAIIILWDQTHGRFPKDAKTIPEAVLRFEHVFTKEEMDILLVPQETDFPYFTGWENLIDNTRICDLVSYSYFQKTLSLVNELPLFLRNHDSNLIYSITLGETINYENLFSEMCESFKQYYRFLISVLTNQYFLSSAFDNSRDLQSIKTFEILYKIINSNDDMRKHNIHALLCALPEITENLIKEYLTVLKPKAIFDKDDVFNHSNKIKNYIEMTINQYYPKLFEINFKPEDIFESLL